VTKGIDEAKMERKRETTGGGKSKRSCERAREREIERARERERERASKKNGKKKGKKYDIL